MFSNVNKVDKILSKFHRTVAELRQVQEDAGHESNQLDVEINGLQARKTDLVQEGQRAKSIANKLEALLS